jgi:hypothetical protein
VGQIELEWVDAKNTQQPNVTYPSPINAIGKRTHVGPYVYSSVVTAAIGAAKRYWQMRRPYGIMLESLGPAETNWLLDAGDAVGVQVQLHDEMLALNRTYMIQQATHTIDDSALTSVFQLLQISRSDEQ